MGKDEQQPSTSASDACVKGEVHLHHHGSAHDHKHHHHPGSRSLPGRALDHALILTVAVFALELAGGFWTHSLALLSDSVHMAADIVALALSRWALWMSQKNVLIPEHRTFGNKRVEILVALGNGVLVWLTVGWILFESLHKLNSTHVIHTHGLMAISIMGLLANLFAIGSLHGHAHDDLNIRSSYLHIISDLMGSIATVAAGFLIEFTGFQLADVCASIMISVLILISSWKLIQESVEILMESAPKELNLQELEHQLRIRTGALEIHQLRVWRLNSKETYLSAHLILPTVSVEDRSKIFSDDLKSLQHYLRTTFWITSSTLQFETSACHREIEEPGKKLP